MSLIYGSPKNLGRLVASMIALPPTDGSLLLSQTIGFHLERNPTFPVYMFAEEGSESVTAITFLEFARACHRVAHHVRPAGLIQQIGQVVAIIASCDTIVYQALVLGCLKAGLVVSCTVSSKVLLLQTTFSPSPSPLEIHLLQ